ncbi:hypothetical protein RSAG8_08925, partial [Rhizoctonia solani AG-8 WAC10335]
MENPQISQTNDCVYTPPALSAHLATIYDLKPIVGQPTGEEVKTIHAAIRAVNAEAQIPHLCNPELSLQLSQHLFSVQMAVYRSTYPLGIFPRDNTYTPPSLPTHIPVTLEPVIGPPSNDQLKAAQDAMHIVESRGCGPLFDSDLNMQLSQHLFNLQFARYIQDSTLGRFTSKPQESRQASSITHSYLSEPSAPHNTSGAHPEPHIIQPELRSTVPAPNVTQPLGPEQAEDEPRISSEITQLGQAVNTIKELMSESKGVPDNINRVPIATQRSQVTTGAWETSTYAHINPVNDQGVTAVEYGLPQLRYHYKHGRYFITGHLNVAQIAGYLKFFGVGGDLIEGDDDPQLKAGKQGEAETLILKHIGLVY